jgi:hypothetical protein
MSWVREDSVTACTSARPSRHRPLSRVSSYLGLGSRHDNILDLTTPPVTLDDPSTAQTPDGSANLQMNAANQTWRRTLLIQMAETLQEVMMRSTNLTPIPVQYNSHVLHLIEAARELHVEQLKNTATSQARERELEFFKEMSEEWIQKETDYKAEIRRLEKLLARESVDGMQAVALARGDSVVDRNDARRFATAVRRVSQCEFGEDDSPMSTSQGPPRKPSTTEESSDSAAQDQVSGLALDGADNQSQGMETIDNIEPCRSLPLISCTPRMRKPIVF